MKALLMRLRVMFTQGNETPRPPWLQQLGHSGLPHQDTDRVLTSHKISSLVSSQPHQSYNSKSQFSQIRSFLSKMSYLSQTHKLF
ncbi:unnamed protein product [Cuscuta campestris]|uniref:Uncharacterized protein n=1 Tax=Cuscuta campestris TaxID=132261 RepID=A0A484NBY9_9ASTE|nr:unnamed protein product [Cuscuta campestris]